MAGTPPPHPASASRSKQNTVPPSHHPCRLKLPNWVNSGLDRTAPRSYDETFWLLVNHLMPPPRRALSIYICPSCRISNSNPELLPSATRKLPFASHRQLRTALGSRRRISSVAPVTSIHVPRSIPEQLKQLDVALSNLGRDAATYTDSSQLRLARRGIESENPVTRIASEL